MNVMIIAKLADQYPGRIHDPCFKRTSVYIANVTVLEPKIDMERGTLSL